jgi:hypothetical protein
LTVVVLVASAFSNAANRSDLPSIISAVRIEDLENRRSENDDEKEIAALDIITGTMNISVGGIIRRVDALVNE